MAGQRQSSGFCDWPSRTVSAACTLLVSMPTYLGLATGLGQGAGDGDAHGLGEGLACVEEGTRAERKSELIISPAHE